MRINHNIAALNTYRQLSANDTNTQNSLAKLSSGLGINKAGDDAAGLAISEKMRGQIRGLDQAASNAQDGISLIQTAEGALNETHSILQRMRELAVQSANDTNTDTDRNEIQKEVDQLTKELTRISNDTEFNTQTLLNGGMVAGNVGEATFQIGSNASQNISVSIGAMDAESLGLAEDVEAVQVSVISNPSTASVLGAEIQTAGGQYLTGGQYTVETIANGTRVDILMKDIDGNVVASKTGYTAAVGEVTLTVDGGAGANVITLNYNKAMTNGDKSTISIDASGANITTASTAFITAEINTENTLRDGEYTITAKAVGGTYVNTIEVTNSTGEVIGTYSAGASTSLATATTYSITLDDGAGTLKISTDASTAAAANETAKITVDNENEGYVSGASSAATFASGELSDKAVAFKGIDVRTQANADAAITKIQTAVENVSAERSKLGAFQNRLEHTINNLGTSSENLSAAESRIRDVDMAKEMMEFTKQNILSQAAQAMLAQANQLPEGVLQLLR